MVDGFSYLANKAKEKEAKHHAAEGRPDLAPQRIVTEGHEVPLETLTKRTTIGKIAWAAQEHGWTVKLGESEYMTAEAWRQGKVVPGKIQKHHWCQGVRVHDGEQHHFTVSKLLMMIDGEIVDDKDEILIEIAEHGDDTHSGS